MNKIQQLRIEKITLNIGAGTDQKLLEKGMKLIKNLTGISPIKTKTLKRIPAWGLRPNLPIGCKLTLRGEKAIEILKRLIVAKKNVLKSSCFDSNGNFTYEQDAMTDHEVIAWKMDEQNAAIMSIQSQQMWSNINSGGNYQRNINQQNLNNMWWDY